MKRVVGLALLLLLVSTSAAAQPPLVDLVQKLARGPDFRVRVSAALQLGKTKSSVARAALETALDDENAAVRAAAAAALKVIGDPMAISVLERHENDGSPAVRSQIKTTLTSLRGSDASSKASAKPEVLVQVGKIGSGPPTSGAVLDDIARASKQKLRELPGVELVDEGGNHSAHHGVPLVMLTGRVRKLEQYREGGAVVCKAAVEFVLHKMPGQTIKGVVSGTAKASGSAEEVNDARAMAELKRSALEAAIESAVKNAPTALRAAAQ